MNSVYLELNISSFCHLNIADTSCLAQLYFYIWKMVLYLSGFFHSKITCYVSKIHRSDLLNIDIYFMGEKTPIYFEHAMLKHITIASHVSPRLTLILTNSLLLSLLADKIKFIERTIPNLLFTTRNSSESRKVFYIITIFVIYYNSQCITLFLLRWKKKQYLWVF